MDRKIGIFLLKYIPPVGTLLMTAHVALLLLGYSPVVFEMLFGFSLLGSAVLLLFSHIFRFCWLHRAFILYNTLVDACINIRKAGGFDRWLFEARVIVLCVGVLILAYFCLHFKRYNKQCHDDKTSAKKGASEACGACR